MGSLGNKNKKKSLLQSKLQQYREEMQSFDISNSNKQQSFVQNIQFISTLSMSKHLIENNTEIKKNNVIA